jgi:hypothetical protein
LFENVLKQITAEIAIALHKVHQIINDLGVAFVKGLKANAATIR